MMKTTLRALLTLRVRCLPHRALASILLVAATIAVLTPATASAGEPDPRAGWAVSAGYFDTNTDFDVAEIGLEYRFRPVKTLGGLRLKPMVGISANEDDAFWAYGGVRYDYAFAEHWVVAPSLAITLYEDGDSKDLGGTVQFRSSLELSYRLRSGQRVGVAFYHLSNAGIQDPNPGEDSLVVVWSF